MKTLLIAISSIFLLLFTSCEKDEMGDGGLGGGGMQDANIITRSSTNLILKDNNEIALVTDPLLKIDE